MSSAQHFDGYTLQLTNKYGGLEVNEAKPLKDLEAENNKLKRLLAEKLLEVDIMKSVMSKMPINMGRPSGNARGS